MLPIQSNTNFAANNVIIKKISLYERKGYIELEHDYYYSGFIKVTNITSNIPSFIFEQNTTNKLCSENNKIKINFNIMGNKKFPSKGLLKINAKITIYEPTYE